ncbi:PAP2 (acid phosphatase) superfamily protein [Hartmannibacter diazotrophicus]|uniref:PAP2 (Acid phosphatase) superfamily protein n=1 Tax=Hartmannibacter diazotrophicus TaxID=1482074 RepID=A0A2C9DAN6_9HYPH|nr:phosphatase PAP2 family protein [Hartmannibacter diazotrophicus]SON57326.1 PAP2 (acid phosphatase) superfamily protein [Hartmannibacter diazotrophicus]
MKRIRQQAVASMAERPILWLAVATTVLSLVFVLFPEIDLAASRLFYVDGEGFPVSGIAFFSSLRRLGQAVTRAMVIVPLVALLVPFLFSGARFLLSAKSALFLLLSMAVGPGFIVNVVLKGEWGRARPREITEFGGTFDFSRAWEIVHYCQSNCSFVSAEAAASMQVMALALICPPAWRRSVAIGAFAFALVMSVNRMAFGGHFLSDVTIAWLLTLWVMFAVHRLLYVKTPLLTDEAIAGSLGRAGDHMKRALGRFWCALDDLLQKFK